MLLKTEGRFLYAVRTKVSVLKNHVNGLGYKDGKLIVVHNGYIADTKEALEQYKKNIPIFGIKN
jgi:hypothetical protein